MTFEMFVITYLGIGLEVEEHAEHACTTEDGSNGYRYGALSAIY